MSLHWRIGSEAREVTITAAADFHLMVSRHETARPLLTPGEMIQLPATDELVLVSGCRPIRARKARYFEDHSPG